jgi:hypothetical protein
VTVRDRRKSVDDTHRKLIRNMHNVSTKKMIRAQENREKSRLS